MTLKAEFTLNLESLDLKLSLELGPGPAALIGPNGSGKTTLLRLLAGALQPDEGCLKLGEELWFDSHKRWNMPIEKRRVGYVPQGYCLFPHMTAAENIAFGLTTGIHQLSRNAAMTRALEALRQLDCLELAARTPEALSGGEQQRIALARALAVAPRLLLLDEPLAALDSVARRGVRKLLAASLEALDCPTLLVTHELRDLEMLNCQIIALEAGRIVQKGTLLELRANPATDFVAEFVQ